MLAALLIAVPVIVSDNVVVEPRNPTPTRPPVIVSDDVVIEPCEFQLVETEECEDTPPRILLHRGWTNPRRRHRQ